MTDVLREIIFNSFIVSLEHLIKEWLKSTKNKIPDFVKIPKKTIFEKKSRNYKINEI